MTQLYPKYWNLGELYVRATKSDKDSPLRSLCTSISLNYDAIMKGPTVINFRVHGLQSQYSFANAVVQSLLSCPSFVRLIFRLSKSLNQLRPSPLHTSSWVEHMLQQTFVTTTAVNPQLSATIGVPVAACDILGKILPLSSISKLVNIYLQSSTRHGRGVGYDSADFIEFCLSGLDQELTYDEDMRGKTLPQITLTEPEKRSLISKLFVGQMVTLLSTTQTNQDNINRVPTGTGPSPSGTGSVTRLGQSSSGVSGFRGNLSGSKGSGSGTQGGTVSTENVEASQFLVMHLDITALNPNAKSEISAAMAAVRHGGQFVDIPEVGNIGEVFDALYQTQIWTIDSNGNQTLISPPTRQMMMEAFASRTLVGGQTGSQTASQAQRGTRSVSGNTRITTQTGGQRGYGSSTRLNSTYGPSSRQYGTIGLRRSGERSGGLQVFAQRQASVDSKTRVQDTRGWGSGQYEGKSANRWAINSIPDKKIIRSLPSEQLTFGVTFQDYDDEDGAVQEQKMRETVKNEGKEQFYRDDYNAYFQFIKNNTDYYKVYRPEDNSNTENPNSPSSKYNQEQAMRRTQQGIDADNGNYHWQFNYPYSLIQHERMLSGPLITMHKTVCLHKLPQQLLIIHLNRFVVDEQSGRTIKLQKNINYPRDITLEKGTVSKSIDLHNAFAQTAKSRMELLCGTSNISSHFTSSTSLSVMSSSDLVATYTLVAVIEHKGDTLENGRFVATVCRALSPAALTSVGSMTHSNQYTTVYDRTFSNTYERWMGDKGKPRSMIYTNGPNGGVTAPRTALGGTTRGTSGGEENTSVWVECDDTDVRLTSLDEALQRQAYILVYMRKV